MKRDQPSTPMPPRIQHSKSPALSVRTLSQAALLGLCFALNMFSFEQAYAAPPVTTPEPPNWDRVAAGQYPANHGPRAGYIRTEGDLATELVPHDANAFELFVLDSRWVDLSVKDYKLTVSVTHPAAKKELPSPSCSPAVRSFNCTLKTPLVAGDQLGITLLKMSPSQTPKSLIYKFPYAYSEQDETKSKQSADAGQKGAELSK